MDSDIALVTGANKGIGREIVRQLAGRGLTVYLGARDERRGAEAEKDLREQGCDVRFVRLDVTDAEEVSAAADRIGREAGRLDVLVNNAGVAIEGEPSPDPEEITVQRMRAAYEVNVFGTYAVTRACLPLLRRSAAGRVVNVSSSLGSLTLLTDPASTVSALPLLAYNSSKAALNALTVMQARILDADGIRVNAANPGLVGTDLNGMEPEVDGVRTVQQGARVPVRLALEPRAGDDAGALAGAAAGRFVGDDEHATDGIVPW